MYGVWYFLLKDRNTVFYIINGVEWRYSFLYAYQIQINKYDRKKNGFAGCRICGREISESEVVE